MNVEALTPQEREVLLRLAAGLLPAQIARELFISKRTVDFHLGNIYRKLAVRHKMTAILAARARGWI